MANRRKFLRNTLLAGVGIGISGNAAARGLPLPAGEPGNGHAQGKRIGIIGLDTSHSVAFTKVLNATAAPEAYGGYKIVAAYPKGSNDIQSSVERIPGYTRDVEKLGVTIVDSIEKLLAQCDVVMLETNDGRLHLQQALKVIAAGKTMFIDKPVAASLKDAIAIFDAAAKAKVPVFSSSSLRYVKSTQDIASGSVIGKVLGADTYSPAPMEKTHPDLFWYGIHGVETLYTLMGTGCRSVVRAYSEDSDVVVGTWSDNRLGTFRGLRAGTKSYGGVAFGEKGIAPLGNYEGYEPLLVQIIRFFQSGIAPVSAKDTIEICAFMEAADESRKKGGAVVSMAEIFERARK